MTKRLYYQDAYLREFKANIESLVPCAGGYEVILDQTAFYPTGGGQPHDTGSIGSARVLDVTVREGQIIHLLDRQPETGENVSCLVDWARRFDHMQQHLGEHLLSGAFWQLFEAGNVGFRLGADKVTIDITKDNLTAAEADQAEALANQVVYKNLPVHIHYPALAELKQFKLRKDTAVTTGIRLVEVPEADCCACGGTHPGYTGEVGIIKITGWERYKGNTRVEFVCGQRALNDYRGKNTDLQRMARLFSLKPVDCLAAVEKLRANYLAANKEIARLKEALRGHQAAELLREAIDYGQVRIVHRVFNDMEAADIKALAQGLSENAGTVALLGLAGERAHLVFHCAKDVHINMGQILKEVLSLIDGKGGGSEYAAQGSGSKAERLEQAVQRAVEKISAIS